jgi:hypothetical protein
MNYSDRVLAYALSDALDIQNRMVERLLIVNSYTG